MKKFLAACAGVVAMVGGTRILTAQAQINTTAHWDHARQIGMFGALPASTAIGQTFTVPSSGNILDTFSFWLDPHPVWQPNIVFRAFVQQWNGSSAVGNPLWVSNMYHGPTQYMQQYTFSPGGLFLTPGHQYIAYLSTIGLFNQFPTNAQVVTGFTDTSYHDGHFVSVQNVSVFSQLTANPWNTDTTCPQCSAAFVADFRGDITTVPEPSSMALLGTGLVGLVPLARRKRTA